MKEQEKIFFALCLTMRHRYKPRQIIRFLCETIPHKRCWYYLQKWTRLGFYNYGVNLELGWFEMGEIPDRYVRIVLGD